MTISIISIFAEVMMYGYDDRGKSILTDLLNERVAEGEAFDPHGFILQALATLGSTSP